MKWLIMTIFCFATSSLSELQARSIRAVTFSAVVSHAELIAIGFVYSGTSSSQESGEVVSETYAEYCARLERTISGTEHKDRSICFLSVPGLKVGVSYLLFFSEGKAQRKGNDKVDLVAMLALEIKEPNSFHGYPAVRWEPITQPLIPELSEQKAVVEYHDAGDSRKDRVVVAYSYYPLDAVERIIRDIWNKQP